MVRRGASQFKKASKSTFEIYGIFLLGDDRNQAHQLERKFHRRKVAKLSKTARENSPHFTRNKKVIFKMLLKDILMLHSIYIIISSTKKPPVLIIPFV